MNTLLKRFASKRSFGMMALRGLAALVGSGPLALGETHPPVEARLGHTMLPPSDLMVMVIPLIKGEPVTCVLALAKKLDLRNSKGMDPA